MTTKIKIPKQLYVVFKDQGVDQPLFGFLHAYEPGKPAFDKKKQTQLEWAYDTSYIRDANIEVHGMDMWLTGYRWGSDWSNGNYTRVRQDVRELLKNPPAVWDNTPLPGFKIEKSVSRYSTSDKLWRIGDPRGAEFEISTDVLEQIINDATILKGGVIDAKCAWAANKNLVVVD